MRPNKDKRAQPPSHLLPASKLPDEVKEEEDPPILSPHHHNHPKGPSIPSAISTSNQPYPSEQPQTNPGASHSQAQPPVKEGE